MPAAMRIQHQACLRTWDDDLPGLLLIGSGPACGVIPTRAVQEDFQDRQYYTTGQLTQAIFDDQCAFIDPTTTVKGPRFYSKAVASLFDASSSRADLISAQVIRPAVGTLHVL